MFWDACIVFALVLTFCGGMVAGSLLAHAQKKFHGGLTEGELGLS